MTREIKFRAFIHPYCGGEIPQECYNTMDYSDNYGGDLEEFFSLYKLHFFEIMQYTGLKDKAGEGNDVYEGDLFECIFSNVPNGFKPMGFKEQQQTEIAEVVFIHGGFKIKVFHPDYNKNVFLDLKSFLENEQKVVIGNIHENPELL